MTDFKFKVGMSTTSIMSNLNQIPNLNDNSKQLIINFCNNDKDKKITNEIELAMLNSYANNEEKVSMPKTDGMKDITQNHKEYSFLGAMDSEKIYQAGSNRALVYYKREDQTWATSAKKNDLSRLDNLIDRDSDGFADCRMLIYDYYKSSKGNLIEEVYMDDDIDGIFDRKYTNSSTYIKGFEDAEIRTDTNLHTNEVTYKTKYAYKQIDDKDGNGYTDINIEIDMLTGIETTTKQHVDTQTLEITETVIVRNIATGEETITEKIY